MLTSAGVMSDVINDDSQRIRKTQAGAVRAGIADRVTLRTEDLFGADIQSVTTVTLWIRGCIRSSRASYDPDLYRLPPLRRRRLGARALSVGETRNRIFRCRVP